jgi:hypothetical protein
LGVGHRLVHIRPRFRGRSMGASGTLHSPANGAFCGPFRMELARLEPATSWVRYGRWRRRETAWLGRFLRSSGAPQHFCRSLENVRAPGVPHHLPQYSATRSPLRQRRWRLASRIRRRALRVYSCRSNT